VAMILEVLHPSGARTWHRLGDLPLTVGRGLTNDLILDDPYVDARHARIALDESGAALIEDLGSLNGLVANDARLEGRVPVQPGAEIRVGRTMLRFRDPAEPVSPALVDVIAAPPSAPAMVSETSPSRSIRARVPAIVSRWAATTSGRLLVAAVAMSAVAIYSWMGSSERSSASEAFFAALAFASTIGLWAGIWAVASRVSVQRFHFVGHVAVASLVTLGALIWTMLAEWLSFFFPDSSVADLLSGGMGFLLLSALVAGHLSLASAIPRKRQWRAGFIVAGTVLVIGGLATLADEDSFTDVPTFSGVVKPIASNWLPTATVDEFGAVMVKLKEQVDEMAKK
jgi:pSer/pThr/pTyr-binding forkhead associated (FHA) protein